MPISDEPNQCLQRRWHVSAAGVVQVEMAGGCLPVVEHLSQPAVAQILQDHGLVDGLGVVFSAGRWQLLHVAGIHGANRLLLHAHRRGQPGDRRVARVHHRDDGRNG